MVRKSSGSQQTPVSKQAHETAQYRKIDYRITALQHTAAYFPASRRGILRKAVYHHSITWRIASYRDIACRIAFTHAHTGITSHYERVCL